MRKVFSDKRRNRQQSEKEEQQTFLVVEGNEVYEIDRNCMKEKEKKKRRRK